MPSPADEPSIYEQIGDPAFLEGVRLVDAGNAAGLRAHLREHPALAQQHVLLAGRSDFRNPTLLGFIAENPVRNDTMPDNAVEIARILLEAGAKEDKAAIAETLGLVCSARVPREQGKVVPLVALLCTYGADPNSAMLTALLHAEWIAVEQLLEHGARIDLPVAAATARTHAFRDLLPAASALDRHRALALASQFGHAEIVRLLLEVGEDPNRFNPIGMHSHSTPLHQAAFGGHQETVRLLVEGGACLETADTLWNGTPIGWARHAGKTEVVNYLSSF